eukprot:TRINITY_DN33492_c0_g1_i1.p1 TRINITY_DN33492_c0_g1~~TRINITY_DN33492_c0_g1_i1.p1  ORF type:complete len:594 (+),score=176.89 TRINITY_DN33492_c0_g1_i1:105-1886(+)
MALGAGAPAGAAAPPPQPTAPPPPDGLPPELAAATGLLVGMLQGELSTPPGEGGGARRHSCGEFMGLYAVVHSVMASRDAAAAARGAAEWLRGCAAAAAAAAGCTVSPGCRSPAAEAAAHRADGMLSRLCRGPAQPLGGHPMLDIVCPDAAACLRYAASCCAAAAAAALGAAHVAALAEAAAAAARRPPLCAFVAEETAGVHCMSALSKCDVFCHLDSEGVFVDPDWEPQQLRQRRLTFTDRFCTLVDGVFTPRECAWWRRQADLADSQGGILTQLDTEFPQWYRSGRRVLLREPRIGALLWERLQPVIFPDGRSLAPGLPNRPFGFGVPYGSEWRPARMNDVARLVRYGEGEGFAEHRDANHVAAELERSALTVMLYLDGGYGGGDLLFLAGGDRLPLPAELAALVASTTSSIAVPAWRRAAAQGHCGVAERITPSEGLCVVFDHAILHKAEPVSGGRPKTILRGDMIFRMVAAPPPPRAPGAAPPPADPGAPPAGAEQQAPAGAPCGFGPDWLEKLPAAERAAHRAVVGLVTAADLAEEEGDLGLSLQLYEAAHEVRVCFPLSGPLLEAEPLITRAAAEAPAPAPGPPSRR